MVPASGELAAAVPALVVVVRHVEATSLLVQPLAAIQNLAVVDVAEVGALSAVTVVVAEAVAVAVGALAAYLPRYNGSVQRYAAALLVE